jgi:hypothetical protein
MDEQHGKDWVVPVLNDVATFLLANGMQKGFEAVKAAIMVVRDEGGAGQGATAQVRSLVTNPIREGNVVRFSVMTGDRLP